MALCGIQMFAMVSRHTKPAASNLEARTNEEVLVETSAICQDTGAQLSSVSKKYLPVRGDKVRAAPGRSPTTPTLRG